METLSRYETSYVYGGHYCACLKQPDRFIIEGITVGAIGTAAAWIYDKVDYHYALSRCHDHSNCVGVTDGVQECKQFLGERFEACI